MYHVLKGWSLGFFWVARTWGTLLYAKTIERLLFSCEGWEGLWIMRDAGRIELMEDGGRDGLYIPSDSVRQYHA